MGINEALALRSIRGMDGWTFEGRRANHLDSGLDRRIHSIRLLLVQKQREEVARWISSSFLQLVFFGLTQSNHSIHVSGNRS